MRIYGNIMLQDEFFKGTIEIKDGVIEGIWQKKEDYDLKGTVIPTFVNMHTHLGDYYYRKELKIPLKDVVGPGGLKFEILKDEEKVREGIKEALAFMERCGTSHFVDFREGGEFGVKILRNAVRDRKIKGVILGREELWDEADGFGLSSISDVDFDFASRMAEKARREGKLFALHASEEKREDIEKVLSLNPNFVVHLLEASDGELKKIKEKNVPVVLTPRANAFWGKIPNIPRFLGHGILLALGTDNGMTSEPCMFREMEFTYRISRLFTPVPAMEILRMATTNPRRILKIEDNEEGKNASLIIFKRIMNPYEIVTRAGEKDIEKIIF